MEKFGIFELLDALAALTAREEQTNDGNETEPAPVVQTEKPQAAAPSPCDAAFSAPVYETAFGESGNKETETAEKQPHKSMEADALAGFYARHDRIAKKIKR